MISWHARLGHVGFEVRVSLPELTAAAPPLLAQRGDEDTTATLVWTAEAAPTPTPLFRTQSRAFFGDVQLFDGPKDAFTLAAPHGWFEVERDGSHVRGLIAEPWAQLARASTLALHFALHPHAIFHVHAAALTIDNMGLLIPGGSGAGKTTTALSLLENSAARWLSDDTVYLDEHCQVVGLPLPFNITSKTLSLFPRLAGHVTRGLPHSPDKHQLDVQRAYPNSQASSAPIELIVFPTIAPVKETRVEALLPSDAFIQLLNSSALAWIDLRLRQQHIDSLARLTSCASAFRLTLGTDTLANPRILTELLGNLIQGNRLRAP